MLWKEKKWQFAALVSDQALVSALIADFGYLGYGFAYVFDRATGACHKQKVFGPLGAGVRVGTEPDQGTSKLALPGSFIHFDAAVGGLELRLKSFQARFTIDLGQYWDARWSIPSAGDHRTRKRMGDPARGTLTVGGRTLDLEGHALLDWSRGHLARETEWRWAAGVGLAGGHRIAWNLRTGFNDPRQVENACWVDGRPMSPGAAGIEPGAHWQISAGPLNLEFTGDGAHVEDLDLALIGSRYQQPWGRFTGTWEGIPLEGYGVVEDHWARW